MSRGKITVGFLAVTFLLISGCGGLLGGKDNTGGGKDNTGETPAPAPQPKNGPVAGTTWVDDKDSTIIIVFDDDTTTLKGVFWGEKYAGKTFPSKWIDRDIYNDYVTNFFNLRCINWYYVIRYHTTSYALSGVYLIVKKLVRLIWVTVMFVKFMTS